MRNKGFASIIILVIVALAVGGYFAYQKGFFQKQPARPFASPSPEPSWGVWQSYTNAEIGFSFLYPNNLIVDNVYDSKIRSGVIFGFELHEKTTDIAKYTFTVYPTDKKSVSDWAKNNLNIALPPEVKEIASETKNGISIFSYGVNRPTFFVFSNENKIFMFQKIFGNESEIGQILSTFKFTK